MVQKILIMGFPHSGTSILKKLIGNAEGVHEHPYESHVVTEEMTAAAEAEGEAAVVAKGINFPWTESYLIPGGAAELIVACKEHLARHGDMRFVMTIKNPHDIFGSLNKRFGEIPDQDRPPGHSFREWETWAEVFLFFRANPAANLFPITYEEFFADGHAALERLFGFLDLQFDPNLLTQDRRSLIVENVQDVPDQEPQSRENGLDHGRFRTWQINQPIRDMSGESAKFLDGPTQTLIERSKAAERLGYAGA